PLARDLHEPYRAGGERQHECGLRKRDGPEQRLDVVAVRHLDLAREPVGQPEGAYARGGGEQRQAMRLFRPEVLVVVELLQRLSELDDGGSVGARGLQLLSRLRAEVLQLDPPRIRLRRDRRGGEVDRDAGAAVRGEQTLYLGVSRDVRVQGHTDIPGCYANLRRGICQRVQRARGVLRELPVFFI